MKKTKFKIGDWVETKATVSFEYDFPEEKSLTIERTMFRSEYGGKKRGIFIGMSYRNIGTRKDFYYRDQPTFITKERVLVCLIKEGMINTPIKCLEKDLKKIPAEEFPFCKSHKVIWTEEERQKMSEYSKCFPRDKKGRFI